MPAPQCFVNCSWKGHSDSVCKRQVLKRKPTRSGLEPGSVWQGIACVADCPTEKPSARLNRVRLPSRLRQGIFLLPDSACSADSLTVFVLPKNDENGPLSDQQRNCSEATESLLQKVKSGMGSPDWNVSMVDIHLRKLLWVYCPGHAGMKGSDRADKLAGKVTIRNGLRLGRSEVLKSMRHYLRAQSQGHHTIDRLEERGSARRSSFKGRERVIVSQRN